MKNELFIRAIKFKTKDMESPKLLFMPWGFVFGYGVEEKELDRVMNVMNQIFIPYGKHYNKELRAL